MERSWAREQGNGIGDVNEPWAFSNPSFFPYKYQNSKLRGSSKEEKKPLQQGTVKAPAVPDHFQWTPCSESAR